MSCIRRHHQIGDFGLGEQGDLLVLVQQDRLDVVPPSGQVTAGGEDDDVPLHPIVASWIIPFHEGLS